MVAAVATSAAAGKNPWLPLALIFLLAAPESVPSVMMDPELHRQLHGLGPEGLLWGLGATFAVLSLADSLADKIGFVEKWLVPVSTAWRPFAGVACAALVGVAAARSLEAPVELAAPATPLPVVRASLLDARPLAGGSLVALTIALGALGGWIATMGKTGARLLMSMVPVPGLKLAHSFVDDFFAFGASVAGLAFGDTVFVAAILGIYLAVGLITGPLLTRLTWIHVRIGWSLLRKARRSLDDGAERPPPPRWVRRWLAEHGLEGAAALPAYVFRAPEVGRCRAGHLIVAPGRTVFLTRIAWRPRPLSLDDRSLARVGLADTATSRVVTLVERLDSGGLREVFVYLFPAVEAEVLPVLARGAERAGLVRVRVASESSRAALPGYADRTRSVRFLPASAAGSLHLQGLLTIAAALGAGLLTGGVFVPIGTGYLVSPFKRRLLAGWLVSGYLSLCVLGSMGLGWPAAVLYASVLNGLALRDLTRNALKARTDGFVDRRAWLPVVCGQVWVPAAGLLAAGDRWRAGDEEPPTDGSWRAVVGLLADVSEDATSAPAVSPVASGRGGSRGGSVDRVG
jgi:hypothetical protein